MGKCGRSKKFMMPLPQLVVQDLNVTGEVTGESISIAGTGSSN